MTIELYVGVSPPLLDQTPRRALCGYRPLYMTRLPIELCASVGPLTWPDVELCVGVGPLNRPDSL